MARERAPINATVTLEQCLAVQYAISNILAEAPSLDAAIMPILQTLGTGFHWRLAALWLRDTHPPLELRLQTCWAADEAENAMTRTVLALANHLPERAWHTGEPIWNFDIDHEHQRELRVATKKSPAHMHWAGVFPIRDHGVTLGVITWFYHAVLPLDANLQRALVTLGNNIGQFIIITHDVGVRRQMERQTHDTLHAVLEMAKTFVHVAEAEMPNSQADAQPGMLAKVRRIAAHMAEVTRRVFACRHVSIMAVDPATDLLYPMAVAGLTREQEQQWWQQQPLAAPLATSVNSADMQRFRAGEVLWIDMTQPPYNTLPNIFATASLMVAAMKIGERIVGVLSLDNGATPQHYMPEELELVGAVAKLAALVLERERLLSEREAARANELALGEANRRMDEFLSIASHELKTPLTSVKGYIQLAAHRLKRVLTTRPNGTDSSQFAQFDQSLQGAIDLLMRSDHYSDVLNRLVTELLDVTRIQSNTIAVYRTDCDLVSIVTEAVKMQRLAWPARAIHLDIAADLDAAIHADAARISQVITNFLTNAISYSATERQVAVTMHHDDDQITVAVRDEGPGLSEEEQRHIWERFYRGAGQHQYVGTGGLGIGLYISRTIIEQHMGRIGVQSTLGTGSTFWFSLPLSQAPA